MFIGHKHIASGNGFFLLIPASFLIVLTLITALTRAGKIKKYPPVVAFRKGIKTHHFGKNVFAVEKTKGDINTRLGLKGLFGGRGQNVGMFICVLAASLTITFCILLVDLSKTEVPYSWILRGWRRLSWSDLMKERITKL